MGLRDRRGDGDAGRETTGSAVDTRRYRLKQKLLSIGHDYWVEDEDGERVFRVDGKALRFRKTAHLEDLHGRRLCTIQKRVMHLHDAMEIEGPEGDRIALVHKALIAPLRERWNIDVEDGPDLVVRGDITDHEYEIQADGRTVAQVSKRWFTVRDSYGVEMAPDQNPILLLAVTVAIDEMAHAGS